MAPVDMSTNQTANSPARGTVRFIRVIRARDGSFVQRLIREDRGGSGDGQFAEAARVLFKMARKEVIS